MSRSLYIPKGYKSALTLRETQHAIKYIKDVFQQALSFALTLDRVSAPLIVKQGSGINDDLNGVERKVDDLKFGKSSARIVIEEFLTGPEVSVLSFTDGKTVVPMISSMDHKRALDGDKGLNTGGMGTLSPNPYYTDDIAKECMEKIFLPTINAMNAEGRTFEGCLYFGLMITPNGPKVIEYNCRFGDPETQVVLPMLDADLYDIFEAIYNHELDKVDIKWHDGSCACVVMASGGYPESYPKGIEMNGLDEKGQVDGCFVYHAGTKLDENGKFLTNGGRVIGVTAKGVDLRQALDNAADTRF